MINYSTVDVSKYFDRQPWPWQERGFRAMGQVIETPSTTACLAGPTGSGKSASMNAIIRRAVEDGRKVSLLTNRVMLAEQLYSGLVNSNIHAGIIGAEFKDYADPSAPVQLCMTPTIGRRILAKRDKLVEGGEDPRKAMDRHPLPDGDLCIIDEPHMNAGLTSSRIVSEYLSNGGNVLGYTATPIGIDHLFDQLVVAGTNSECRRAGALVPAVVYGCPEYDCRSVKGKGRDGNLTRAQHKKLWSPAIFSYIFKEWKRTNPDGRMSIGFGPGVDESVWLAEHYTNPRRWIDEQNDIAKRQRISEWEVAACEQWYRHGVRAAHIDGTDCWLDGKRYKGDRSARSDIIEQWKDGKITIVWNRWVLREGIDVPPLYHMTIAAVIGSLQTYLQIVGRVIRYSDETPNGVVINDHGANAWRHGSPNEDRPWDKLWRSTEAAVSNMRRDEYREGRREEPIVCPKCRATRRSGSKCHQCGHEHVKSSRLVIQENGVLKEMIGSSIRKVNTEMKSNTQKLWDQLYWSSYNAHRKLDKEVAELKDRAAAGDKLAAAAYDAKMAVLQKKMGRSSSFAQAYGLFFIKHGYWPPKTLKNMPRDPEDWYLKVRNVERRELN